jgi:dTDP-4-amino-4,6-dideoxygalactose transaminase
MTNAIQPFDQPVYVTRPILPDLQEVTEKLREVWESGWLTNNGHQHQVLEQQLTDVLKVPYLSLFNNGTIALITACQALRVSGEVITTPFSFPATPHVLTWNNVKPIFCDIDPVSMNIDPARIEAMITPHTSGILATHVYGTPCDVEAIQEIADRYGLKVIYDAAHAFGTEIDGRGIGTYGDATMFSFHATKLFHTAEGGALSFRDDNLKTRIDYLKNFGIKNEEEVIMPGINGKMNEMQAALGLVTLRYVEEEKAKRRALLDTYRHALAGVPGISLLQPSANVKSSCQYFVIRIDRKAFGRSRDFVYDRFREYNVYTRKYFSPLCSDYSCYRQLPSSNPDNLPVARKVVQEVLAMPLYGGLANTDVERICAMLRGMAGE